MGPEEQVTSTHPGPYPLPVVADLLSRQTQLGHFSLVDNNAGDDDLSAVIAAALSLNTLTFLELRSLFIQPAVLATIAAALSAHTPLRELVLVAQLNDEVAETIQDFFMALAKPTCLLTHFRLSEHLFSPDVMQAMTMALETNHSLIALDLSGNLDLHAIDMTPFIDAVLAHPTLEDINLNDSDLSSVQLQYFWTRLQAVSPPHLKRVSVNSQYADKDSEAALIEFLKQNRTVEDISAENPAASVETVELLTAAIKDNLVIQKLDFFVENNSVRVRGTAGFFRTSDTMRVLKAKLAANRGQAATESQDLAVEMASTGGGPASHDRHIRFQSQL